MCYVTGQLTFWRMSNPTATIASMTGMASKYKGDLDGKLSGQWIGDNYQRRDANVSGILGLLATLDIMDKPIADLTKIFIDRNRVYDVPEVRTAVQMAGGQAVASFLGGDHAQACDQIFAVAAQWTPTDPDLARALTNTSNYYFHTTLPVPWPDGTAETNIAIAAAYPGSSSVDVTGSLQPDGTIQVGYATAMTDLNDVVSRLANQTALVLPASDAIYGTVVNAANPDPLATGTNPVVAASSAPRAGLVTALRPGDLDAARTIIGVASTDVAALTALIGLVDPVAARVVSTVGNAAITVAAGIVNFVDTSAKLATALGSLATAVAGAALTGNFISAAVSVVGLLMDTPDPNQAVLDAIQAAATALSSQMTAIAQHEDRRFDAVDAQLRALTEQAQQGFTAVLNKINNVDVDLLKLMVEI